MYSCVSGKEVQLWLSLLQGCVCHKSAPAEAQAVESFREGQHGQQDSNDHGANGWAESQAENAKKTCKEKY